MRSAFTYILECNDGTYYCGWTLDIKRRVLQHNQGKGSKYTRARLPVALVYLEGFTDPRSAQQREYAIKQLTRTEKTKLISAPAS